MSPRSLLFVPGDRPERMEKALRVGADALILDLEDSVAAERKAVAREAVARFLGEARGAISLFVRINPIGGAYCHEDVALLAAAQPDGIILPKAEGRASVEALYRQLVAIGAAVPPILPIVTETPSAIFEMGSYRQVGGMLAGLTWGAEDLPAAMGATASREPDGRLRSPYELARSLALFAAHAAAVPAIETVYPDFRDLEGLGAYARRAAEDGFAGMMAIHPAQVPVINAAFEPTEDQIAHARRIVRLFATRPGEGAMQYEGVMIDAPHLKQARALLARAGECD
ncbi:CoA ester lyase [Sphingobium sp. H39-3-25]|uniref:HpcH/HpaI aldolase/citrate lyase family protein n=1 Tax=Sphingobium arseniciresistens TaxID=3030834 RepID=UPI0023B8BF1A|nr:CoA ester lyase [Sphingobium arseniciresistens]